VINELGCEIPRENGYHKAAGLRQRAPESPALELLFESLQDTSENLLGAFFCKSKTYVNGIQEGGRIGHRPDKKCAELFVLFYQTDDIFNSVMGSTDVRENRG
jgi:hypothetical protein